MQQHENGKMRLSVLIGVTAFIHEAVHNVKKKHSLTISATRSHASSTRRFYNLSETDPSSLHRPTKANSTASPMKEISLDAIEGDAEIEAELEGNAYTIECWSYATMTKVRYHVTNGDSLGIVDWLMETAPSSLDGKSPLAGLRLVCFKQTSEIFDPPDQGAVLKAINLKALGIPENHTYFVGRYAGACGTYFVSGGSPVFLLFRFTHDGAISVIIKYDSVSNITIGYVLYGRRISVKTILKTIENQFFSFPHPLFVPTVVMEITATDYLHDLREIHTDLTHIERQTGFGIWSSDSKVAAGEYQGLTRELSNLNCLHAWVDVAIRSTQSMAIYVLKELDSMEMFHATNAEHQRVGNFGNSASLRRRIELLQSRLYHAEIFGGIRDRLQVQQNVLFNLISQRDSNLNYEMAADSREIAAASRRDSSSMKVVAFVTTFFLPGTFVSALFAMPLFNWSAESANSVLNSRLWIYWAVALPLTLSVMGIIGVYIWFQSRKKALDTENARKSTHLKEA